MNDANLNLLTASRNSDEAIRRSPRVRATRKSYEVIKEIPWRDIWTPLAVAKRRGNLRIATVFLDSLFEEALFDDAGAWIAARN